MSEQQNKRQLLKDQLDASVINEISSKPLIEYKPIEGTPFTTVKEGNNISIALGRYIITHKMADLNEEDVPEWLELNKWDIIVNLVITISKSIDHLKSEQK